MRKLSGHNRRGRREGYDIVSSRDSAQLPESGPILTIVHFPHFDTPAGLRLDFRLVRPKMPSMPDPAKAAGIPSYLVWQAPLAPFAWAASAGIIADRAFGLSWQAAFGLLFFGLVGWVITSRPSGRHISLLSGCAVSAALAALHHHQHLNAFAADDIGNFATEQPRLVRLRGQLVEEPAADFVRHDDPLVSRPRTETTRAV